MEPSYVGPRSAQASGACRLPCWWRREVPLALVPCQDEETQSSADNCKRMQGARKARVLTPTARKTEGQEPPSTVPAALHEGGVDNSKP